jgi:hypothetical protein
LEQDAQALVMQIGVAAAHVTAEAAAVPHTQAPLVPRAYRPFEQVRQVGVAPV